jgi:hypothetical protein
MGDGVKQGCARDCVTTFGQYHSVVKVSSNEGMTAQWQHTQRQFHLPFRFLTKDPSTKGTKGPFEACRDGNTTPNL